MKQLKISLLACLFYFCFINIVFAEPQVTVAVFPFDLQSETSNEKIIETLPQMLKNKLEKDGAKIIFINDTSDKTDWTYSKFREEGIKLGADWIITGNVFMAGQRISIDTQMRNVYENKPYFDLIIGGHSHSRTNTSVNNIPIFQAGSNLDYLGKIKLTINDATIESISHELIDLSTYTSFDTTIKEIVDLYNEDANLDEVIGFAEGYHSRAEVGCFYTDALRNEMNVDLTFQNTGGVRADLNEGDVLKREIYTIDPFNNGSVTYTMTVGEIETFLKESRIAIYYSGVLINQVNSEVEISTLNNELFNDSTSLTIGLNDYIPAVYDTYFTQVPNYKPYTTAEAIINYLETNSTPINYIDCNNYFKFQ